MSAPLLLDLTHTSHTRARTGVQRVARSLHRAWTGRALALTHDPYRAAWRPLEPWEQENLAAESPAAKRGALWPLAARVRGRVRRALGANSRHLLPPGSAGLVVPEIFSAATAAALPALFAAARGPRVAVFHDAIALQFPEFAPAKTMARFPPYLRELLAFDGIAAVSEDSRAALVDYWRWLGAAAMPPVAAITLGVDVPATSAPVVPNAHDPDAEPVVLSVGSIEGRKNHLALLDACEQLWAQGRRFTLHLIGLAQPQTGGAALARLRALQAAGRPLRYDGPVGEAALEAAYAACTFTVYPSPLEGFGLPVLESVGRARPCICSARGALGESARGGGCLALDTVGAADLAPAIARLLDQPAERAALAHAARARRFRTWQNYADDLAAWLGTLTRRD